MAAAARSTSRRVTRDPAGVTRRETIDQATRDRVRDEHDVSLFVEAGAGTGKTTALVDRVVALVVTGGLELRELAAITFTEAAASELRDRIRDGLEAVAAGRRGR